MKPDNMNYPKAHFARRTRCAS